MTDTKTLTEQVVRFVTLKQQLGYRFTTNEGALHRFARFAGDRHETFIQTGTVLEWACESTSDSRRGQVRKLHMVHPFACWLHAEDDRHEVPDRAALGPRSRRRPSPCLMSIGQIRTLLASALSMESTDPLTPRTWYTLFGLIATTGLRISEALSLTLDDFTADGLLVRKSKFRKSRRVVLHATAREALNRYLMDRHKATPRDDHLFVLASTGRSPSRSYTRDVFRRLAQQTGLREGNTRGPTPHSLRHAFAVRSIEQLGPDTDPHRHMLALATYLGHANISDTYWYLEATPVLLQGIAEATERSHARHGGGTHD